ncbi:MAG: hypothetical protein E4H09_04535, partial [Spirochaetales bacterium]
MKNDLRRGMGFALLIACCTAMVGAGVSVALHWSAGGELTMWTNYISDLSVGLGGARITYPVMLAVMSGVLG